jgi:hypothetical protein
MTYLHDGSPEVHSLGSNLTVPQLCEVTLLRYWGFSRGCGALESSLSEAHPGLHILAHRSAEAQTESGGHGAGVALSAFVEGVGV